MKWIFVLLVLASVSFAQFGELIEAHHAAAKNKDWDAYIDTFDTGGMSPEEIEAMREIAEAVWERYDTDFYLVSNVSSITEGEDALVQYHLNANISGAESAEVDGEYFALLHMVGGEWKIVFNMPLEDYLEISEGIQKLKAAEAVVGVMDAKENQTLVEPPELEKEGGEGGCLPAFVLLAGLIGAALKK